METFNNLEDRLTNLQTHLGIVSKQCNEIIEEIEGIKHASINEKIVWLRNQGMTYQEIANSIGVSKTTILNRLRKLGLVGEKEDVEQ